MKFVGPKTKTFETYQDDWIVSEITREGLLVSVVTLSDDDRHLPVPFACCSVSLRHLAREMSMSKGNGSAASERNRCSEVDSVQA